MPAAFSTAAARSIFAIDRGRRRAEPIQLVGDPVDVVGVADERRRDEVDAGLGGELEVSLVGVADEFEPEVDAAGRHAGPRSQAPARLDASDDGVALDALDRRLDAAVVEQHRIAGGDGGDRVREADRRPGERRPLDEPDRIARAELDRLARFGRPDLRPLEIEQGREGLVDPPVDGADVFEEFGTLLDRSVTRVQPGDGHPGVGEAADRGPIRGGRAERADDLDASHTHRFRREDKKPPPRGASPASAVQSSIRSSPAASSSTWSLNASTNPRNRGAYSRMSVADAGPYCEST